MLDNVELITYMKFQKLLMTGCRDMDKKHQKCPQNGFFPHLWPPIFFFKNQALSLLYHYGALTSCKKSEKINERSMKYLKTDQLTNGPTDKGDYWGPPRVNPKSNNTYQCHIHILNTYPFEKVYCLFDLRVHSIKLQY